MLPKQYTREFIKRKRRESNMPFDEKEFNRIWKSTTQRIRRIAGNVVNPSTEAMYYFTRESENVLSYIEQELKTGVRGRKKEVQEHFRVSLVINRTSNFMAKNGNKVVDGKRLKTWLRDYKNEKISKDEFYSKIDLFKSTNKKYLAVGSK